MKKIIYPSLLFIFFSVLSCSKTEIVNVKKKETLKFNKDYREKIEEAFKTMPMIIKVKDEVNNRFIDFDVKNRTMSVSKSWSFSNPQPNTIYAQGGGLIVYVSSASFGFGSSSSTSSVTAGNTTLNVQTLCLAVDVSMFAAQSGPLPIDGISVVMGLDADFGLLQNASSTNFGDYFHGLAYYLVYDSPASGAYAVFDWTGNGNVGQQDGFAMLFSFTQNNSGAFYFSKDGDITVSGSDMTFNGNYWGIETDFSTLTNSLTFQSYPGSGTMGCN